MQECSLYSEGEFIMKSNNIRRIFLSSVSIVLMAVVVGCTNEKKEDNISSLATSTTSISSSDLSIPSSPTPTNNTTPTQNPSNPSTTTTNPSSLSPTGTPDTTPTEIESELEAELESIIESTNPADITDTPVQIEGETQQGNSTAGTGSQTQGSTGQTQAPSGTQGTPSQDTEVKQPNEQTQQNGAANNQVQSNQGNTSTSGGARLTGPNDPRFDANYVNPRTGVMLDYDGNGIPDPLEIGKPGKVETVDGSKYGFVKPE